MSGNIDVSELHLFRDRLEKERKLCIEYINEAVKAGKRVFAYGDLTKRNVILQYYGLASKLISRAADLNYGNVAGMCILIYR